MMTMTMTMTISMAMPMAKHLFISKSFLFWWVSRKIGHQWLGSCVFGCPVSLSYVLISYVPIITWIDLV